MYVCIYIYREREIDRLIDRIQIPDGARAASERGGALQSGPTRCSICLTLRSLAALTIANALGPTLNSMSNPNIYLSISLSLSLSLFIYIYIYIHTNIHIHTCIHISLYMYRVYRICVRSSRREGEHTSYTTQKMVPQRLSELTGLKVLYTYISVYDIYILYIIYSI